MKLVMSQSEPEVWARITLKLAGGYGEGTCKMGCSQKCCPGADSDVELLRTAQD